MTYAAETLGSQLQIAREHHGLSQRALATMSGTTQSRISRIENGDIDLRISTLLELARNLDLEFMLIPRQHLTAVRAIVTQQPLSSEEKSLRVALIRLQEVISRLTEKFPETMHLRELMRVARELSNLRLHSPDLAAIKKVTDTLKLIEQTPALISAVHAPLEDLKRVRNTRAHDISEEPDVPRPAYRLEDEDNA